jgi:hypothetical protein
LNFDKGILEIKKATLMKMQLLKCSNKNGVFSLFSLVANQMLLNQLQNYYDERHHRKVC